MLKLSIQSGAQKMRYASYGLAVLVSGALFAILAVHAHAATERYLIDFGDASTTTTATGWNNITGTQENSTATVPLIDATGASSTANFHFTDTFGCAPSSSPAVNTSGTTSSTVYPSSATSDSFYLGSAGTGSCTQNDSTAGFTIGGLSSSAQYDVIFYASRVGDSTNRTTVYAIGSQSAQLNATNNTNAVATISNVTPTNGSISATVTKPSSSAFGYLGVIEVVRKTAPTNVAPTINAGSDSTITLPTHSVTLTGSGADSDGTIASYAWSEVSNGAATITSPASTSTSVTDLAAGTYTFRLTATDNSGATATDDVQVVVNPQAVAACSAKKIVVVGSSTAAGTGASPVSNSWVNRFTAYMQQLNASNNVTNLALAGFTTYDVLPTGSPQPPSGRPSPDTARNISAAIAASPQAIIVNMPSNDIANGYSVADIEANFQTIKNAATQAGIPIWFTTTQPRDLDQTGRTNQATLRDWLTTTYAPNTLDFWSTVANADGSINATYAAGDGIHLNNLGHQKLYNRVAGSNLITSLCSSAPVISSLTSTPIFSQNIAWQTDTPASTKVEYGTSQSYGSTTPETDTTTKVTAHQVVLSGLTACTTYYYRAISKDAANQERISAGQTFATPCS